MSRIHVSIVGMSQRPEGPLALPPLNALRAFEYAARLGSFTRAAEELSVTQTAISHQVRQLEEQLGVSLFVRSPRKVVLTPQGLAWAEALTDVFARLYAANRRLRNPPQRARPLLSISVIPSFASRWLVPRLGRFLEQHPTVDVHISPTATLVDLAAEGIDFGIRYGPGRYPGLRVQKLFDDAWIVVCSPTLRGREKLRSPEDLVRFPLLQDDEPEIFHTWLTAQGVSGINPARVSTLTDSGLVVDAAARGQGVALARWSLALEDLQSGRLQRAFPRLPLLPTGRGYHLVSRKSPTERSEGTWFRTWISNEVSIALQSLQSERRT